MPEKANMPENLNKNSTQDLKYVDKPRKLFIVTAILYVLIFGLFIAAAFFFKFPVSFNALMLGSTANHTRIMSFEHADKLNPGDQVQLSVNNNKVVVTVNATIVSKEQIQKGNIIDVNIVQQQAGSAFFTPAGSVRIPVIITKKQRLINFLFDKI